MSFNLFTSFSFTLEAQLDDAPKALSFSDSESDTECLTNNEKKFNRNGKSDNSNVKSPHSHFEDVFAFTDLRAKLEALQERKEVSFDEFREEVIYFILFRFII